MRLRIKALDTWFFRDGHPFNKGEDFWANSTFPPSPGVLYGAIRAAYLNLSPTITPDSPDDPTKEIRIAGIYFEYDHTAYYIAPKDLVVQKEFQDNCYRLVSLKLLAPNDIASSLPTSYIPYIDYEAEEFTEGMISADEYDSYLNEYMDHFTGKSFHHFIIEEPKIGIGINNITKAINEGQLYRLGMKRPVDKFNIIVDLEVPETLQSASIHYVRMGGENRISQVEYLADSNFVKSNPHWKDSKGKYFKLHLLTPGIFTSGWFPDLKRLLNLNYEIHLIAACIGKYIPIGGFDIQQNAPKTMYRMAPAGSVYYYEAPEGKEKDLINAMNNLIALNDIEEESERNKKNKEGFGLFKIAYLPLNEILQ